MAYRRGPAHSGNRPRFKPATTNNENVNKQQEQTKSCEGKIFANKSTGECKKQDKLGREVRKCGGGKLQLIGLLLCCASVFVVVVSATTTTTQNHAAANYKFGLIEAANDNLRSSSKARRLVVRQVTSSQMQQAPLSHVSGLEEVMKVAALASKLEHWLTCRRLSMLSPEQVAALLTGTTPSSSSSPSHLSAAGLRYCPAHFDGHLCWPPTSAGEPTQLACPQLNWLQASAAWSHLATSPNNSLSFLIPNGKWTPGDSASIIAPQTHHSPDSTAARLARRACEPTKLEPASYATAPVAWQPAADYSQCKPASSDQASKQAFDPTDRWIHLESSELDRALFESLAAELDRIVEGAFDPYGDPDLLEQWTLCIGNIMRQQQLDKPAPTLHNSEQLQQPFCPIIFDGWRCWPSTRPGEIAYVGCPSNQPGFTAERQAHKICTLNGTWYRHPETNRYWSNYTTCVDTLDLEFRTKILKIYVIGNTISLVALLASLIIFMSFKSLKCTRVTIHKNLFLSFITNNLMWIIWYTYVVSDATLLQSNPIECRLWHIVLHYFLVSNYFWMFCEGLYLHTLLVVAFVREDKILKWFYILGWFTPIPITIAYAYNRSYDSLHTHFCWMDESPYNFILMAPIGVSLLLNLIFLINIVRLLVTKLRANNTPDAHQTRKAVRATLFLIPLLGLHYILTPFRPEPKSEWEKIYEIITAVCTSFQGLCVAMLFCFCNGEVISVLRKKLQDLIMDDR